MISDREQRVNGIKNPNGVFCGAPPYLSERIRHACVLYHTYLRRPRAADAAIAADATVVAIKARRVSIGICDPSGT